MERRSFLKYVGAGAVAGLSPLGPLAARAARMSPSGFDWVKPDGLPAWESVAYPVPLPGDAGTASGDAARLASFTVRDELVVPEGFEYDVIAAWGDQFGATRFGHNCDYTGLLPVRGRPGEYWLFVNHEYISGRPWLAGLDEVSGEAMPKVRMRAGANGPVLEVDGVALPGPSVDLDDPNIPVDIRDRLRRVALAGLDDLGVSILHVRIEQGRVTPIRDSNRHVRISALHPEHPTFANCGGGTTPWGTFLTCEENFQDHVWEGIDHAGETLPGSRPFAGNGTHSFTSLPYEFLGLGQATGLDGRDFGWTCEVDPETGHLSKLHRLGRFRHENVMVVARRGQRLGAYMGDDRRGGHVWKYISRASVENPDDPSTGALLRDGTLHAARFRADHTGTWLPLSPDTPLARPLPEETADGSLTLPDRRRGVHGDAIGGHVRVAAAHALSEGSLTVDEWIASIEAYTGRSFDSLTLRDLIASGSDAQRVIDMDAFVFANAIGATPTARPEAIVTHPHDGSAYVAFTDTTGSREGSPDRRIFAESAQATSRRYGAIFRIVEAGSDVGATEFEWGRFVSSGETADGGGGFACADNLAFDDDGNLWMVCDISTSAHNYPVRRTDPNAQPGQRGFAGVFGNNAIFMIPTHGPRAGMPHCFAIGPCECELTGPTFLPDGSGLLLSVQHPGEMHGPRQVGLEQREYEIQDRAGTIFTQRRTVPRGSNFPGGRAYPRPSVVLIRRERLG